MLKCEIGVGFGDIPVKCVCFLDFGFEMFQIMQWSNTEILGRCVPLVE